MKKWFEPLSTAWIGLVTHKLRSFLTILGIVIGVAAVIALMSIGKGAQASIVANIESLGSNLLFVRPGFTTEGGVRTAQGSATSLTLEDGTAIEAQVPYIAAIAPYQSSFLQVVVGTQNMRAQVISITPEYQQVFNLQTTNGDFISDYQYQSAMKVAVLGANAQQTLFNGDDPIGQPMRVGNSIVRVVGVLQSKGTSMLGFSDDSILIPLPTLQQMVSRSLTVRGERVVNSIVVSVSDKAQTKYVIDEITNLLRYRHQIVSGGQNDFTITSAEELIGAVSQALSTMTLFLGAIAAISLLVGGIGVMNIMLVSVIERTREIGIRKALGAREQDIWGQFLIEAVFLTFTGGIIGVIVGWSASLAVANFGGMTTLVSVDIVLLAVSVAVGIGVFFGFYPAWQASRLNPIEALRYE